MILVRVMKRKDASSVLVAVVLAMLVSQFLSSVTIQGTAKVTEWAGGPANTFGTGGAPWQTTYLQPFAWLVLGVVAFEVLAWVYVWAEKAVTSAASNRK